MDLSVLVHQREEASPGEGLRDSARRSVGRFAPLLRPMRSIGQHPLDGRGNLVDGKRLLRPHDDRIERARESDACVFSDPTLSPAPAFIPQGGADDLTRVGIIPGIHRAAEPSLQLQVQHPRRPLQIEIDGAEGAK